MAPTPPTPPKPKECGTCLYWDNSIGPFPGTSGLCRRSAPVPLNIFNSVKEHPQSSITYAMAVWPATLVGENCGEHKFPKAGAAAEATA